MKLGVYTAVLHDRSLDDALGVIADLALEGAEINAGGFLPPVHIPIDAVIASAAARDDYLEVFAARGIALAGLNANGNPLHPDPEVRHGADLKRAIVAAGALGQTRVVTMSGLPAAEPGGGRPSWAVNPWDSVYLDTLDYQWNDVVIPFWKEIDLLARDHNVKVAIEMHPNNVVFNPATLERLVDATGATNVGAELDPSHLFWQGMDPIVVIEHLGPLIFHAAAKDVRINKATLLNGVLDDRFRRVPAEENPLSLGGRYTLNEWPADSSWDFVALGRGHDVDYWTRFLDALHAVDPDMAVNIEHEDTSLGRIEGLEVAAKVLKAADRRIPHTV